MPKHHWPIEWRSPELACFLAAFESLGFSRCEDGRPEGEIEKIAFYCELGSDEVLHAARQLDNGRWSSKLDYVHDIEHRTFQELEGTTTGFGEVRAFMRRKIPAPRNTPL